MTASDLTSESEEKGSLNHAYYVVSFMDLLGQKEAFLKTDRIPVDAADQAKLIQELKASIGTVRNFHRVCAEFQAQLRPEPSPSIPAEFHQTIRAWQQRKVNYRPWSDGTIMHAPLSPTSGHAPIMALYDMMMTCAAAVLIQLGIGDPIRGGIDVGTAIEVDGQLFGAAMVKAYKLESEVAKHTRLVVGETLVNYLDSELHAPAQDLRDQFERKIAARLRLMIVKDEDDAWIVDYLGPQVVEILGGTIDRELVGRARVFVERSREKWREANNTKLFERYSRLLRYFDSRIARV